MAEPRTIRPLPELDQTRGSQVVPFKELRAQTAELRDRVDQLSADAKDLHARVQSEDLDRRAMQRAQTHPADLLTAAAEDLGMSWNLLARLMRVSPTAIRKWRRGQPITPDNRRQLALVIAFSEALHEVNPRITDASLWLETRLHRATTLTGADLFAAGRIDALLDVAAERMTATEALDMFDPQWKQHYPADENFGVVVADDGIPSIVPAGGGDPSYGR
jgi:hypothetical protein